MIMPDKTDSIILCPMIRFRIFRSHNRSVMKPYGVWVVIAPYNFRLHSQAGPVAAALITGNTVVLKTASDTPWSGRLLADCLRDAAFPGESSIISMAAAA